MGRLGLSALGLAAQAALLGALAVTVGLTPLGWVVGMLCTVVPNLAVARHRPAGGADHPTPADQVTLLRAVIACAVAALVADSFVHSPSVTILVTLSGIALALDAVDGRVARHTRMSSAFGARFDGEVDAFLILVLSVYVARGFGPWVLAIGLVRYVFWLAGWRMPWLRAQLPPRYWRKVVAAVQGVVLTVAAADLLPRPIMLSAVVVAAVLLAESFGHDVVWLWRRRHDVAAAASPIAPAQPAGRGRRVVGVALDVLALLVVWGVLVAPTELPSATLVVLLRIPAELLVVAVLALALAARPRRIVSGVLGVLFAVVMILKLLDMGFYAALDRPFDPVTDFGLFGPMFALVRDTVGRVEGDVVGATAVVVVILLLVAVPLSLGRVTSVLARHRRRSVPVLAVLTVLWLAAAAGGWQLQPGEPVASASSARVATGKVGLAVTTVRGEHRFTAALAHDRFRDVPAGRLLTGLRGKNVVLVFVESYGRIAVDGPKATAQVRDVLRTGAEQLRADGYRSRSAFLSSPTFGGHSWLAHSTLQSGLPVTDQGRYERLLSSDRMTLSGYFQRAGWRTVAVQPSDSGPWPQGKSFYHLDQIYNGQQLGYHGPRFGFSLMPDQFALEALHRRVLAPARAPVFVQVELASSHTPWAPLPRLVPWERLGDGTVFGPIHHNAEGIKQLWDHHDRLPGAYARSIAYTLQSLTQFVQRYGDGDLVLIMLGDHQPATIISGYHAGRDVPVTIITRDPDVLAPISGWRWQPGLLPDAQAPAWPMEDFRDRFLEAYDAPSSAGS